MNIIKGSVAKLADRVAMDEMGFESLDLMETASEKIADYVRERYGDRRDARILVLAGVGNNGADGIAAARMLLEDGFDPEVRVAGDLQKASWEFLYQWVIFEQAIERRREQRVGDTLHARISVYHPGDRLPDCDVCIDGVFGIGLHREIKGSLKNFLEEAAKSNRGETLAIDAPSGIDTDTGSLMGVGLRADVTITFGRSKTGLLAGEGREYSGEIIVEDIGIPDLAYDRAEELAELRKSMEM